MQEWNVLVTSLMGRRRDLARALRDLGEFKTTGYRDVMLGRVASATSFLEKLSVLIVDRPEVGSMLGRAIPFDRTFQFANPEDLKVKLFDAVADYAVRIEGKKFYVRMERRGFKGKIVSPEVEKAVDQLLLGIIDAAGGEAAVDFKDPDAIIVIETVSNLAGISLLSRELREKYQFVRVE